MVILNDVVPINYNHMNKNILKKTNGIIIKILDDLFYNNEKKDQYIKYISNNMNMELKTIFEGNNFLYSSMNNRYCIHIYKRGIREGTVCGAKIEIKANKDEHKYLCSRHCRSYESKSRNYITYKRCSYIRNNNELCKHICKDNNKYCYIHKKYVKEYNDEYIKRKNIERLKNRRKLYFKMKRAKNSKNSKIKKTIFKYITYNDICTNIIIKNKNKYKNNIISTIYYIT